MFTLLYFFFVKKQQTSARERTSLSRHCVCSENDCAIFSYYFTYNPLDTHRLNIRYVI